MKILVYTLISLCVALFWAGAFAFIDVRFSIVAFVVAFFVTFLWLSMCNIAGTINDRMGVE